MVGKVRDLLYCKQKAVRKYQGTIGVEKKGWGLREESVRGETGTRVTREHEGQRTNGKVDEARGLRGERGEERVHEQQEPARKSERGRKCKPKGVDANQGGVE